MIVGPIENLWLFEQGDAYNAPPEFSDVSFLSRAQQCRLERIRQATMLFQGRHKEFFLAERRTQFDWPTIQAGQRRVQPFVPLNLLKLISKKTADLLFGEDPKIECDDEVQEQALVDLSDRSSLRELLKNSAIECSYESECFIEGVVYEGEVYQQRVPAREIFPVGRLMPDRQFASYVRYTKKNLGDARQPIWILLETTYLPGRITRELYQLGDKGAKTARLDLSVWQQVDPEPVPLEDTTLTGIGRNTITWIPNELDQDQAVSDYDGLMALQDAVDFANTQIFMVIAKHADPAMAIPEDMFDNEGNIRSGYKALPFRDKLPQYIVWNGELEAAKENRWFAINQLLILAEMSPALLGLKEGAAPDSYKKLRLEATNALGMAARKGATWQPRIKRMLSVAQELEQTIPGTRYNQTPIAVTLNDGIPIDDLDQARTIQLLTGGKQVMSIERAVASLIPDKAGQEKELDLIEKEQANATPSIFMSPGAGEPAGGEGNDGDETDAGVDAEKEAA